MNALTLRKELSKINNTSAGSFFKTVALLRKCAEGYRDAKTADDKSLYSGLLENYGALNINNGTGKYLIVL